MSYLRISVFLLYFLIFFKTYSQFVPEITGSKVSKVDAQSSLDFHNKAREIVKVPPLTWSVDLAKYAQEWADHLASKGCKLEHRPPDDYGENLAWCSSNYYSALDACESWYSELEDYIYGPVGSQKDKNDGGHYTQMVWQTTTHLGIGIAVCEEGGVIIVANYSPPGNYIGKYPFTKDLTQKENKTPKETDIVNPKLYPKINIVDKSTDTITKSKGKWNVILKQSDLQGILNDINNDSTLQIERLAAYYFHQLINKYRISKGKPALYWDDRLWLAAKNYNVYVINEASAWNTPHREIKITPFYTGEQFDDRVEWVSGEKYYGSGENMMWGGLPLNNTIESIAKEMAERAFDCWKNSPGHNENMLSKTHGSQGTAFNFGNDDNGGWLIATTDFGSENYKSTEYNFLEDSEIVKKYKNIFVLIENKIISLKLIEEYKDNIFNTLKSFMPEDSLANDKTLKSIASRHLLYLETNNTSNTTQSRKKNNFYASTTKKRFLKTTKYKTFFYLSKHKLNEKCYVIPFTVKELDDNSLLTKIDKKIKGVFPKKTTILKWGAALSFKEKNNQYYCIIDIVWITKK